MRYRKRPVVIEACQFDGTAAHANEIANWMDGKSACPDHSLMASIEESPIRQNLSIETLEGVMTAREGDYIIKGLSGEFYPCKPLIFKGTYEPLDR